MGSSIILVTGGAGFIGNHLCRKLLEDIDCKVVCIDNLITGSVKKISDLIKMENFLFVNADITKDFSPKIEQEFEKKFGEKINYINRIDKIYHLASIASPTKYKKYPLETLDVGYIGTRNVLEFAKKYSSTILFTSTSEIYGDPVISPQPESYYGNVNTVGERSCYDESKRVAESLMYTYSKTVKTKIVRIFNTYGENMDLDDGRVITSIIQKILNGLPIEIYGTGEQTKSFCYISDMVDGLIKMMNSEESGPINLGNPDCELKINEIASLLNKISNKTNKIMYYPLTENDPKQRKPCINKAKKLLKWEPHVDIHTGLELTYHYFINSLELKKIKSLQIF